MYVGAKVCAHQLRDDCSHNVWQKVGWLLDESDSSVIFLLGFLFLVLFF